MDDVTPDSGMACTECGRVADAESVETEGWRFYPADAEDPHPFCPECAEREFGPAA